MSSWSYDELEWWAACFSIDDNKDKPRSNSYKKYVTVDESVKAMKKVLSL